MFKAAIEREESQACLDYPEREQARGAASMFNVQWSTKSEVGSLKADVGNSYSSLFTLHSSLNEKSEVGSLKADVDKQQCSMFNVQCSMVNDELSCYLVTALFIVKHEASLRQQAKAWCKSHPDCPLVIRRFLSIAKQIRC